LNQFKEILQQDFGL